MHALLRRWLIRGVCCAFLAPLLAVCLVGMPSASANGAYTDGDGRFSFAVPDGWEEDEPDGADIIVQYQIAKPLATFYVTTMPLPDDVGLDDFIPQAFDDFSNGFDDFHPSAQKDATLGGEPAKQ